MKKIIIFICLIFFIPRLKAQIDPVLASQLQKVLDDKVELSGDNGVSAHLIMANGKTWTGTAGLGKGGVPISDTTLFHGASTTKLNIATLVMLLVEEDIIDLDESWNKYISLDVEFDTLITVRNLLNHTSGIRDYLETANSGNDIISDFTRFYNPKYILENIVSDVPDFTVGTNFRYSNSNYVLAALIIEAVTGNPVHVELRNRIWNVLGMNHTYFGAYESYDEPTAGVWWNFGDGLINYSDESTVSMLSYAYGAGNIVSCPRDLGLLLEGVLKGQLLSNESLEEMLEFVPSSYSSWTSGYGIGIHHYSQFGDQVIGHDGYYTNMTDMFHSMNCGFTLVTMTNTQTFWYEIFDPLYDILTHYCTTSNVKEFEDEIDLIIYPNPTQNHFSIRSNHVVDELEIKDILGKVLYSVKEDAPIVSYHFDLPGIYFITIKSGEKKRTRKLIVKP